MNEIKESIKNVRKICLKPNQGVVTYWSGDTRTIDRNLAEDMISVFAGAGPHPNGTWCLGKDERK